MSHLEVISQKNLATNYLLNNACIKWWRRASTSELIALKEYLLYSLNHLVFTATEWESIGI